MTAPHMPMMNDSGLLECPFCASVAVEFVTDNHWKFVQCVECGSRSDDWFKKDTAATKWNTRNGHLWTKKDFADRAFEMQNSDLLEKK